MDFMYFDEVLWQKKRRIQKERWYQMERNKEIIVLKKESKSLSRILGEMKQELDVLTATINAQQALMCKVVGDDCWQEKNSKVMCIMGIIIHLVKLKLMCKRIQMVQ